MANENKVSTAWRERIEEKLHRLVEQVEELNHHLTGDGNPGKGIIVRLDRLEQRWKLVAFLQGAVVSSIIGAVVALLVTWKA